MSGPGHVFPTSSAISAACRNLKFTAPPSSKKILKKRFLELAKEHHPDRAKAKGLNIDLATKKMASLTESYKTLQQVVLMKTGGGINNGQFIRNNNNNSDGGGGGVGARGAQDAASAGFGMGENIGNPAERDESPEAQERRKNLLERTFLPWLKNRREDCPGARPVPDEINSFKYIYGHKVPILNFRFFANKFWMNFVPARGRQVLIDAGNVVHQRGMKMIRAAKFITSDPAFITTNLNYNVDVGKRQVICLAPGKEPPPGVPASETIIAIPKQILNARKLSSPPTLDSHGFTVMKQKSAVTRQDFVSNNETKIKQVFYPEIAALVCGVTGASLCVPFNFQVRSADPDRVKQPAIQGAVGSVHSDYSSRGALNLYDAMCPKELLGKGGKFLVVNAWKNINPDNAIIDDHLALCDGGTIAAPDDFITVDLILRDGQPSEAYRMDASRSREHRWYYYPRMTSDEVLLFTQYSSDARAKTRFTFHSAIKDPTAAAAQANNNNNNGNAAFFRESVEVRCICFIPDFPANTIPQLLGNSTSVLDSSLRKLVSIVSYLPSWDEGGKRWIRGMYYGSDADSDNPQQREEKRVKATTQLVRHLAEEHIRKKAELRNGADGTNNITDSIMDEIVNKTVADGEFRKMLEMHLKPITNEERVPEAIKALTEGVRPDLVAKHWQDKQWAVNFIKQLGVENGCKQIANGLVQFSCGNCQNNLNPSISEAVKQQIIDGLAKSEEFRKNCSGSFSS